jgi:hypothetical protein
MAVGPDLGPDGLVLALVFPALLLPLPRRGTPGLLPRYEDASGQ